jgi:hypothetical protein
MMAEALKKRFKQSFSLGLLRMCGWKLTGSRPGCPSYIVLGAPHTSQWDFFFVFLVAWGNGVDFSWVGKQELFRFPLGWFFRLTGGLPVDRRKSANQVDSLVALFQADPTLKILIPPEGTRRRVAKWKTGFYHAARGAGVPVVAGYIDYRTRECGMGPVMIPTGDFEGDLQPMYRFYEGITPRFPDQYMSPGLAEDRGNRTRAINGS